MTERSASPIIKGYIYQFDKTILEILNGTDKNVVKIENIEDLEIESKAGREAIQCKYLSSKTYSLASIRDAIIPMIANMLERKRNGLTLIQYRFYVYFSESSPKTINLALTELKECLLLNKRDGTTIDYQVELKASDADLEEFLKYFRIDIAEDYDAHKNKVLQLIKTAYHCANTEEIELYYNNALTIVSLAAADTNLKNRTITKHQFLLKTKTKEALYSIWRLQDLGKEKYCRELRKIHFSITNIPPYARFFIIELDGTETNCQVKEVLFHIRLKWSSHERKRKHQDDRYAPYISLLGIKLENLIKLKEELYNEGVKFTDGFTFAGSTFNVDELNKPQTYENQLSLRFINESELIHEIIRSLKTKTKELYQFYRTKPLEISNGIKNIQIKIENISFIKEIV